MTNNSQSNLYLNLSLPLLIVLASWALRAEQAMLPSGEQILEWYIEATGGKAAFAEIFTRHTTGTVNITGTNLNGSVDIWLSKDHKIRMAIDFAGRLKMQSGFDGEHAWDLNDLVGPRLLQGSERPYLLRRLAMDIFQNWNKYFRKVETVGTEEVNGKDAYKAVMQPHEGLEEIHFFDKKNHLIIKSITTRELPQTKGLTSTEMLLGDYRMIDRILMPFQITNEANPNYPLVPGQTMAIESVEHNIDIPKDKFSMPSEVQELVTQDTDDP